MFRFPVGLHPPGRLQVVQIETVETFETVQTVDVERRSVAETLSASFRFASG